MLDEQRTHVGSEDSVSLGSPGSLSHMPSVLSCSKGQAAGFPSPSSCLSFMGGCSWGRTPQLSTCGCSILLQPEEVFRQRAVEACHGHEGSDV